MIHPMQAAIAVALSASLPAAAATPACTATSRALLTPVVELYTSEGCNSCPPADRWFSGLKAAATKGTVVPLAFHVDYWDYIGWKDRFADPAFTARQHKAAARGGAKVVYTPQVLFDGREFMQWRRTDAGKIADDRSQQPAGAELTITAAARDLRKLQVTIAGKTLRAAPGALVQVGLYENDLASDVKAGENKGVRLAHDYVVRRWRGPFAFDRAGLLSITETIDLPADAIPANAGIAVLAVDVDGTVLQSVALPLRDCAG